MTFDGFSFGEGEELWISGWWRIPGPRRLSYSRLMNLGHFEGSGDPDNWYLGLESVEPGTFQVVYTRYGDPRVALLPARRIPEKRWFRVDLHFVLSRVNGEALSEWFINGRRRGATHAVNMFNAKPLTFFNAGLPYFWPGNGGTQVLFDGPRLTN